MEPLHLVTQTPAIGVAYQRMEPLRLAPQTPAIGVAYQQMNKFGAIANPSLIIIISDWKICPGYDQL